MARLIFVHGASANGSSWFDIPAQFGTEPEVHAGTLPGHVGAPTDLGLLLTRRETLDDYVAQINGLMSDGEPVWLIGHSMGGMVISQVAADAADKDQIKGLIYVAAVLPLDNRSTAEMVGNFDIFKRLFQADDEDDPKPFANHDFDDIKHALSNQPPRALFSKFRHSARFDEIDKYYFRCKQDLVISNKRQQDMIDAYTVKEVIELDSDHLPMHASNLQPSANPDLIQGLKDIIDT